MTFETFEAFLEHFPGARLVGDQFIARCPVHGDKHPSLAIRLAGNRILIHCRAQHCRASHILAALGLRLSDLFIDADSPSAAPRRRSARPLSPLAEARLNSLREARREAWAHPGVLDSYRVADGIRGLWRRGLVDEARAFEAEADAITARLTWVAGLAAVAELLSHARAKKGWRGFSPGGDSGWLRRHGVLA